MGLHPAMRAVSLLLRRGQAKEDESKRSPNAASVHHDGSVGTVAGATALVLGEREGVQLPHAVALGRLHAVGLPGWDSVTAADEEEVTAAADKLGYPVALKWDANVAHRARLGGVALGLKSEEAVREAWRALMLQADELGIDCEGVVVQAMVEGGLELFLGGLRDQQFGPIVIFGLGGIHVEEVGQVAVALAPLTRAQAESLIVSSPCAAVVQSRVDGGLLDRWAIVDAILAVSELIVDPTVLAVDVNPLVALPHGVAVVDCKVIADAGLAAGAARSRLIERRTERAGTMSADPGASISSSVGIAMVTGAGSGIGRAVALRLAKEKWDLAIIDMNDDGLQETEKLIEEVSGTGRSGTYVVDVTDAGRFEAVVADIVTNAGEIRVLVSNAGVLSVTPVLELSIEQWRRTVDVNLTGSFICTRAVAREMVRAGTPGRIVTVASVHSVAPGTNVDRLRRLQGRPAHVDAQPGA